MVNAAPNRKRRRLWVSLAAMATALTVMVTALPWLLGTPPVLRVLLAQANSVLAPGGIELTGLRLSWFGPTRMTGLVLREPRGKRVVVAPRVSLNRSVWQLLFDRPHYGTLTLDGAALDIERRRDGSLDLADVFGVLLAEKPHPHPKSRPKPGPAPDTKGDRAPEFTLRVVQGTLRLRSPELSEPLTAERINLTVQNSAAPAGLTWKIALANGAKDGAEALEIAGRFDLRAKVGTPSDLELRLSGRRWPLAGAVAGVTARGRLDGKIDARRHEGLWALAGDARIFDLDAAGPTLADDHLRLDRCDATWDLAESAGAWTIRRLELACPVATLAAGGTVAETAGASTRIEGQLDLAALARQLPRALRLRDGLALERGAAQVQVDLRSDADAPQHLDVEARISDLVARDQARTITLHDPATLSARLTHLGADLSVPKLEVKTAFLDVTGSGDLDRGITLTATFDLGGFQSQLRDLIDFGGLDLVGQGRLAADYHRTEADFVGRLAAEVHALRIGGLTSNPIAREFLRLDASTSGPVADSGVPLSWETARVNLKGGDVAARVIANIREGITTVSATASGPFPFGVQDGRAEGRLAVRWQERLLEFDEVRVGLRPTNAKLAASSIALAAKGRLDMGTGELKLDPIPGTARARSAWGRRACASRGWANRRARAAGSRVPWSAISPRWTGPMRPGAAARPTA